MLTARCWRRKIRSDRQVAAILLPPRTSDCDDSVQPTCGQRRRPEEAFVRRDCEPVSHARDVIHDLGDDVVTRLAERRWKIPRTIDEAIDDCPRQLDGLALVDELNLR